MFYISRTFLTKNSTVPRMMMVKNLLTISPRPICDKPIEMLSFCF